MFTPRFTAAQLEHIKRYGAERKTFKVPTILIVEDQEFSRNLLHGMLSKIYPCYSAVNAEEALQLYAEHIPCIVFLDIELPDMNGHDLAAFLKQQDPDSFIAMVTANHYDKDVKRALENKVQGFVAKPYSKQKILDVIAKYTQTRAKKT